MPFGRNLTLGLCMPILGVDYYPEHWPRERWDKDAAMMKAAGLKMVRLAEFAWSNMEPSQGKFDFKWLDEAIAVLDRQGLKVILGTPTAAPPAWIIEKHPDILPWDEKGHVMPFGLRRHYCFNNPDYLRHSDRITAAMARRYARDPRVTAWQSDNEYCGRCFCPRCEAAFRIWLKKQYKSLDAVNDRWGTGFWSHTYTKWSQIPAPKHGMGMNNPGLHLDWMRFYSDSIVDFQKRQVDIIKRANPRARVTHNTMTMGTYNEVDLYKLAKDLDIVSWDNYPMWSKEDVAPAANAMAVDCARGLKRGNFWVMEQQSGAGGWGSFGRFPWPGEIRLWTWQAVARGADAVVYFRWRTARFGTEQYWHGILDHSGIPNRRLAEVTKVGEEFKRLGPALDKSAPRHRVAFLNTYDSRWALNIQPGNGKLDYFKHFEKFHEPLYRRGLGVDFVDADVPLDRYPLVVAPYLHVLPGALASKLKAYVKQGGILVSTCRSGVKMSCNQIMDEPLPGRVSDLFGCVVEELQTLEKMPEVPAAALGLLRVPGGFKTRVFNDVLSLRGATALAVYKAEHYKGRAAAGVNSFGKGKAVYLGFEAEPAFYDSFVPYALRLAKLPVPEKLPQGVESLVRSGGGRDFRFYLNFGGKAVSVRLPKPGRDLLTGRVHKGTLVLKPLDAAVLESSSGLGEA